MDTKKLRQKILDLAIRGKLVPQDPNDEPASVLLERIRTEKERLVKEGKIKRSKKSPSDTPHYGNEVPFEVPNGWKWCRFGDYLDVRDGTHDTPQYVTEGVPFVTSKNLCNGHIDFSNVQLISETDHLEYSKRSFVEDGDILFAMIGSIGNPVLVKKDREFSIKNVALFKPFGCTQNMRYVYYFLLLIQYNLRNNAKGGMQPFIPLNLFRNQLYIPLPPLDEQARIVAAIEKWFALIDTMKTAKEDLQSSIVQAKSKILDLAIHGKLVPQDPNDEPAIELLKRINPKFESCDNAHERKDIPTNWIYTSLGCIFHHNTGKALNKTDSQEGRLLPYITTSNVYWNRIDLAEVKEMYFKDSEIEKCAITKNDLLVCEGGDIGRSAIWPYEYNMCIQNHIHRLRAKGDISPSFYLYVLMLYKWTDKIKGKGIGLQGLSSGLLDKLEIPLPPYPEQLRIVAKIEELFAILDEIQKSIEA